MNKAVLLVFQKIKFETKFDTTHVVQKYSSPTSRTQSQARLTI